MGSKAPSRVRIPQSPPVFHASRLTEWPPVPHNSASAPVAQLDRAPGYELGGREFESLRARHRKSTRVNGLALVGPFALWAPRIFWAQPVPTPCPAAPDCVPNSHGTGHYAWWSRHLRHGQGIIPCRRLLWRRSDPVSFRARRRLAREAEGAPLLREYGVKSSIEGSNPSVSASFSRFKIDGMAPRSAQFRFCARSSAG